MSWKPNETNRLDTRNFSHALVRRLPAEVAYDAIAMATAGKDELAAKLAQPANRAIGTRRLARRQRQASGRTLRTGRLRQAAAADQLRLRTQQLAEPAANDLPPQRSGNPGHDRPRPRLAPRSWSSCRSEAVADEAAAARTQSRYAARIDAIVAGGILRTLSRPPSAAELAEARQTFHDSDTPTSALRNLLWALLNTKEFIVNH